MLLLIGNRGIHAGIAQHKFKISCDVESYGNRGVKHQPGGGKYRNAHQFFVQHPFFAFRRKENLIIRINAQAEVLQMERNIAVHHKGHFTEGDADLDSGLRMIGQLIFTGDRNGFSAVCSGCRLQIEICIQHFEIINVRHEAGIVRPNGLREPVLLYESFIRDRARLLGACAGKSEYNQQNKQEQNGKPVKVRFAHGGISPLFRGGR